MGFLIQVQHYLMQLYLLLSQRKPRERMGIRLRRMYGRCLRFQNLRCIRFCEGF